MREKPTTKSYRWQGPAGRPARGWHPPITFMTPEQAARLLRRRLLPVFAVLAFAILPYRADAAAEEGFQPGHVASGSLLLRMRSGYEVATRINTEVDIAIAGLVARTRLRQTFRNDGKDWVEGIYVFPLPDSAAVDRMRLVIGERIIEGEVREKAEAKAAYEKARAEGRRASLVRQQRSNLFTTSVANIGPGETVSIDIEYLDTVRFDEGTFSLRFPLTLTPRYIPGTVLPDREGSGWSPDTDRVPDASTITPPMVPAADDHRVTFTARIDAGTNLEFVASRYHPVEISESNGSYDVRFAGSGVTMDHDVELLWRPVSDLAPRAMLFAESFEDEPHLLVMLMPPNDDDAVVTVPPRELVFVIDTSGSMHGVSIEQARKALLRGLNGLRPVDRFNVIQFNSATEALYPASVAGSPGNVDEARRYVGQLAAEGGTEMRPALVRALSEPRDRQYLRQVIFITDGSVGNEDELFGLIERDLGASRLFTVGIGSAPNSWFMRKAAESGRGSFVTISALHEVEEQMSRLFRKLERPAVTDIRVRWPGDLDAQIYPDVVPDLYAGEPIVLKARLKRPPRPGDQLVIEGRLPTGDWGAEIALSDARSGAGVASTWARAHIAHLVDRERRGEAQETIRAAVLTTALRHRIVSKYTSLVAVDKTPVRPLDARLGSDQVPNLMPYGQSTRAIFGFPATATAAPAYRRTGALFIALGTVLLLLQVWFVRGRGREKD